MDHEPLVTNETFDAFAKRASNIELLVYFNTTRDIVAFLDNILSNATAPTQIQKELTDFCAERKEFMQRNGYGIIHSDYYAKIRAIQEAERNKTKNKDNLNP